MTRRVSSCEPSLAIITSRSIAPRSTAMTRSITSLIVCCSLYTGTMIESFIRDPGFTSWPGADVTRSATMGFSPGGRMSIVNSFETRKALQVGGRSVDFYSLAALQQQGYPDVGRLPYSLKILLENLLRHEDGRSVKAEDVEALARWDVRGSTQREMSFAPARGLLQDFTGVPCVVDL